MIIDGQKFLSNPKPPRRDLLDTIISGLIVGAVVLAKLLRTSALPT